MRLLLFTDTLGDVNGVARFIHNVALHASSSNLLLKVFTSTRRPVPNLPNIRNFPPLLAVPMPGYSLLDLAAPPIPSLLAAAKDFAPDIVHISTPGPVGLAGRWFAARSRLPIAGVYHTDFPAYVDKILNNDQLTSATAAYMRWFYRPFSRLFLRSNESAPLLATLGLKPHLFATLRPGIATEQFQPAFADDAAMHALCSPGLAAPSPLRILYVGRVSIEKNMPALVRIWQAAQPRLAALGIPSQLVIVGDGPYLPQMRRDLATTNTTTNTAFLGFRHGAELAMCYASSHCFVFPSLTDTLGQVVMEAQSSGLPVIVSDQGGPKDMVRDGITGRVLPLDPSSGQGAHHPGNLPQEAAYEAAYEAAWIDAIITYLRDPLLRAAHGANAHRWMSNFSFAQSFKDFIAEHQSTLDQHRAASPKALGG